MKVGFTGTRHSMTINQAETLKEMLEKLSVTELHHGDCIGADAQAHKIAKEIGLKVVLHPPTDHKWRAFCQADKEREAKPYLLRNQDIVDETDMLMAAPQTKEEQKKSGTWSTVRYARKKQKPLVLVFGEDDAADVS